MQDPKGAWTNRTRPLGQTGQGQNRGQDRGQDRRQDRGQDRRQEQDDHLVRQEQGIGHLACTGTGTGGGERM